MKKNKTLNDLSNDGILYAVIIKDDSHFWRDDIVKKAGKIEGVYLIDLTQPTHLCELSVSYPYEQLKNFIKNWEKYSEDELTELEMEGCDNGYFGGSSEFKIVKIYTEGEFEEAYENERCNPTIC